MSAASLETLRINSHQFDFAIRELGQFVAIRSVSHPKSEDFALAHLEEAARFVATRLQDLDFEVRYTHVQEGTAPYVLAQRIVDVALPTILLYGHYDVQPVEREKWNTDPFQLVEKGDRLYGRGASDDKAGVMAILTALRAYRQAGRPLPVNIKILIEGDEEYGAMEISKLLELEAERLQADALVILDGGNRDVNTGTIENSTRGVVTLELEVNALQQPIHSGVGVLAPDPAQALAALIHSLRDPRAIPGFMDDCLPLSADERETLRKDSQSSHAYARENGVIERTHLRGDPTVSVYERIREEPSISILNMTCGKKGGGNSIQASAHCTIGVRLTPGQNPERIAEVITKHLNAQVVPWNLPIRLEKLGLGAEAWTAKIGSFSKAYLEACKENYRDTAMMPTGGTIPLMQDFERAFPQMEVLLVGVEDPETAAHSHNESQHKGVFERTTNTLIAFLEKARHVPIKG